MHNFKIGAISFLNAKPIFYGLEKGLVGKEVALSYDLPAESSVKIARGELDVAIVPTIQYARIENLKIIPGISIASVGPVGSVNLYCNKPLEKVKRIALDQRSRTSVALLKILCQEYYNVDVEYLPMVPDVKKMLKNCDACLIIGDDALYFDQAVDEIRDLSSDWFDFTGLPFVFAFLAGGSGMVQAEHVAMLQKSLKLGQKNVGEIARNHFVADVKDLEKINLRYLTKNINYQLGGKHLEGLKLFYRKTADMKLIDAIPEIRFYDEK